MSATKKATEPDTLVTVRLRDTDGTEHVFHGTTVGTVSLRTGSYNEERTGTTRFNHAAADQTSGPGWGPPRTWLRVYSATGAPFPVVHTGGWGVSQHRLAEISDDAFFGLYDFYVRTDSENVDVRVAGRDGKVWVEANLSIDKRRERLIERITALDPALADEADRLISDVDESAFDRGRDAEWRANND